MIWGRPRISKPATTVHRKLNLVTGRRTRKVKKRQSQAKAKAKAKGHARRNDGKRKQKQALRMLLAGEAACDSAAPATGGSAGTGGSEGQAPMNVEEPVLAAMPNLVAAMAKAKSCESLLRRPSRAKILRTKSLL